MKVFCSLFGLFLAVVLASAMKLPIADEESEYAMVPDGHGNWILVNVNEDPEPENFFSPETDIVFTLFTNDDRDVGQVIQWDDPASIANSGFNPLLPTRLTIHGWNGDPTSRVNTAVRAALFEAGQFNVIMVDWSRGAGTINYLSARNRVGPVGVVVAGLLRTLAERGADTRQMTLIGHSLGAHVAGFAGKNLVKTLGAIVALDAALPRFSINRPDERLNNNDAAYVQSIHTNAGTLGFDEPIGDGSFYPNGGSSQPGCGIDISGNCAHGRAHEFYAESLTTTTGFWSTQCADYTQVVRNRCESVGPDALMGGEPLNTDAVGVYFLTTGRASPFALGERP